MTEPTKNATLELIKRLSTAIGVSDYAGPNEVQTVITTELSLYVDYVDRDRMGSVIGVKKGTGPAVSDPQETESRNRRIMLAAHLDEIGAIVTTVEKGFLLQIKSSQECRDSR
jgi:endoglucanase